LNINNYDRTAGGRIIRPHGIYSGTREEWEGANAAFGVSTFVCIEDEGVLYFTGAKYGLTFEEVERQAWRVKLEPPQ